MKEIYDQRSCVTALRSITDYPSGVKLLDYIGSLGVPAAGLARRMPYVTERIISVHVSAPVGAVRRATHSELAVLDALYQEYMDHRIYAMYIQVVAERRISDAYHESGMSVGAFCRMHGLPARTVRRILQDREAV